jgi:hypothetical protein
LDPLGLTHPQKRVQFCGYFLDFSLNPKLEPFFGHVISTQFSSINYSLHTVDPGIDLGQGKNVSHGKFGKNNKGIP